MRKNRVLIIENSIAATGALVSILRSSSLLMENLDFIFVLPEDSSAVQYVSKSGFQVYQLPMREIRKNTLSLLLYLPFLLYNSIKLFRLVKSLRIDLINVNDFYNLIPACYRLLGGRVPYVCYVRFLPSKFPALLVKVWYSSHQRYANSVIAVSEAVKMELPPSKKVTVIGNELPARKADYANPNSMIILYPANYIQGKGQEYALQSFAAIHEKFPAWKLRFVGGDMGLSKNKQYKERLARRSMELGIAEKIEWNDFEEDISNEYIEASFVLNFSESESFSMTCLEAMYFGRPVIATKCGGPSEIIDHNETGILVELNDTIGMANSIEYLINHPAERELMGKNAYQRVRERFSYENTVGRLKKVYDSALLK